MQTKSPSAASELPVTYSPATPTSNMGSIGLISQQTVVQPIPILPRPPSVVASLNPSALPKTVTMLLIEQSVVSILLGQLSSDPRAKWRASYGFLGSASMPSPAGAASQSELIIEDEGPLLISHWLPPSFRDAILDDEEIDNARKRLGQYGATLSGIYLENHLPLPNSNKCPEIQLKIEKQLASDTRNEIDVEFRLGAFRFDSAKATLVSIPIHIADQAYMPLSSIRAKIDCIHGRLDDAEALYKHQSSRGQDVLAGEYSCYLHRTRHETIPSTRNYIAHENTRLSMAKLHIKSKIRDRLVVLQKLYSTKRSRKSNGLLQASAETDSGGNDEIATSTSRFTHLIQVLANKEISETGKSQSLLTYSPAEYIYDRPSISLRVGKLNATSNGNGLSKKRTRPFKSPKPTCDTDEISRDGASNVASTNGTNHIIAAKLQNDMTHLKVRERTTVDPQEAVSARTTSTMDVDAANPVQRHESTSIKPLLT